MATIYTIGFSGKTSNQFMEIIGAVGVSNILDIRLWRTSRFVPWASGTNLANALGDKYRYMPELAPTKELLTQYKDGSIDWPGYEQIFDNLLVERQIEGLFKPGELDKICFLCSEKTADKCHRRLVAEYLSKRIPDCQIVHL